MTLDEVQAEVDKVKVALNAAHEAHPGSHSVNRLHAVLAVAVRRLEVALSMAPDTIRPFSGGGDKPVK